MLVLFPATFYSCVVLKRVNLTEKDERIKLFIFAFLSSMLVLLFFVCVCVYNVPFELLFHEMGQLKQMAFSGTDVLWWF